MKNRVLKFFSTYFCSALDLRVRIFMVLALAGVAASMLIGLVNLFSGAGVVAVLVDFAAAGLSAGLIYFARRTRNYRVCYLITIAVIFMGLFPFLFFRMGGYHGGTTLFLVFAVVYTVFLLEGRMAWVVTALELLLYVGLYLFAYQNSAVVQAFSSERGFLVSNLSDLLVVSLALGVTMYAQMRLYRQQQQKVDEQNVVLAQVNHSKTQFLANTSHEMRTPLTVISVNIQTVMGILKRMDGLQENSETQELLQDAQAEIMRLSRMVGSMLSLNLLADKAEREKTDLTALLRSTAEMLRLLLGRNGNTLETDICDGLSVFGSADLLSQVVLNLLQNANNHTKNGCIRLAASNVGGEITVTVRDNGSGISAALLPRVFERGVTEGGTGVGLFLCKTVVESHSGAIGIESREGAGTTVRFTLPVYQGQFGGDVQ